jgi:hypothetical protein
MSLYKAILSKGFLRVEETSDTESSVCIQEITRSLEDQRMRIKGHMLCTLSLTEEDLNELQELLNRGRVSKTVKSLLDPEFSKQCLSH